MNGTEIQSPAGGAVASVDQRGHLINTALSYIDYGSRLLDQVIKEAKSSESSSGKEIPCPANQRQQSLEIDCRIIRARLESILNQLDDIEMPTRVADSATQDLRGSAERFVNPFDNVYI